MRQLTKDIENLTNTGKMVNKMEDGWLKCQKYIMKWEKDFNINTETKLREDKGKKTSQISVLRL